MITFECYNGLPLEYESFLIEKYDSFITTCSYIEVYYPDYDMNYMLVYKDADLIELLVYGNYGSITKCFNSLVSIDQEIVGEFINKIFAQYEFVKKIEIVASYKEYNFEKSILYFKSDNHILYLPQTMDDYFKMLSSSTRQTVKNRKTRLLRDYKNVNFQIKYGAEIDEEIIGKIIQLNTVRLKQRGKIHKVDKGLNNKIYKFSQQYGCVAYIEVDGEVVAGCVNTMLNKSIFGHITGFDPRFYKYNVGEICAFNLIQTSIEKGLSSFQFLWGKSDLKKRLLGKPHFLYFYFVYRSHSVEYVFDKIKVGLSAKINSLKQSKAIVSIKIVIRNLAK